MPNPDPTTLDPDSAPLSRTPWHIHFFVILAFLIAFGSIAILYQKYVVTHQPNCILLIYGNRRLDQCVARVEGGPLADPMQVTLDVSNHYTARFFLDSATYRLSLTNAQGTFLLDSTGKPALNDHALWVPPGTTQYDLTRVFPLLPE